MSERVEFFVMRQPFEDAPLHYTISGLDYVYLRNGFTVEDDPDYGHLLAIDAEDDLHRAIGLYIIRKPDISSAEFRFLRKQMAMTQKQLSDILKVDVQTVANYEKGNTIPGTSVQLMKFTFALWLMPPEARVQTLRDLTIQVQRLEANRRRSGKGGSSPSIVRCWRQSTPTDGALGSTV